MPIEWSDNLKTGIKVIDEQHQELVIMLNRFGRFRCGRECFNEAFAELEDYTNVHFKIEEDHMIDLKYPEYESHKARHEEFTSLVKDFQKKVENTENFSAFGEEIIESAGNWLINHYSNEDVELAKYIKNISNQ